MRRPSVASTVEWMITSLNGISPSSSSPLKIMRFSQRRMISRAVVFSVPGYHASSSGVSSGQPRIANGQSADENQVSSTSVASRQLGRAALGARLGLGLLDGQVAVRALPDRELVAPPDLARDVPVGRVLERVDRVAVLRGRVVAHAAARAAPRAPAASAPSIAHHHCSEISGSIRLLQRSQSATECRYGLALDEQAALLDPREDPLLRLLLRQAGELAGVLAHAPVAADHGQLGQVVRAADLEVERVVARA